MTYPFNSVSVNKMADDRDTWRSCCVYVDHRCIVFAVQTFLGFALLTFCAYELSSETDCERSAPYWGLLGTIAGFFFNKLSVVHRKEYTGVPTNNQVNAVEI